RKADEHVSWREIAMHEGEVLPVRRTKRMSRRKPCAQLERDIDDHPLGEDLAGVEHRLHEPGERDALNELDGEVRALCVAPPTRYLDHVRVLEGRRHPDLVEELVRKRGIFSDVRVQALYGEQLAVAFAADRATEVDARRLTDGDLRQMLK